MRTLIIVLTLLVLSAPAFAFGPDAMRNAATTMTVILSADAMLDDVPVPPPLETDRADTRAQAPIGGYTGNTAFPFAGICALIIGATVVFSLFFAAFSDNSRAPDGASKTAATAENHLKRRERLIAAIKDLESTEADLDDSGWEGFDNRKQVDQLKTDLAILDGVPWNGHYYWGVLTRGTPEQRREQEWRDRYESTGLPCNGTRWGDQSAMVKCHTCGLEWHGQSVKPPCPRAKTAKGDAPITYPGEGVSALGVAQAQARLSQP